MAGYLYEQMTDDRFQEPCQVLAEGDTDTMPELAQMLELQGRHAEGKAIDAAFGIAIHVPYRTPE